MDAPNAGVTFSSQHNADASRDAATLWSWELDAYNVEASGLAQDRALCCRPASQSVVPACCAHLLLNTGHVLPYKLGPLCPCLQDVGLTTIHNLKVECGKPSMPQH